MTVQDRLPAKGVLPQSLCRIQMHTLTRECADQALGEEDEIVTGSSSSSKPPEESDSIVRAIQGDLFLECFLIL